MPDKRTLPLCCARIALIGDVIETGRYLLNNERMMIPELTDISEKLRQGRPTEPVTVRTFLWWFGAQRRGHQIVNSIRRELADAGIETYPDFESRWVDAPISFHLASSQMVEATDTEDNIDQLIVVENDSPTWITRDPTYLISKLAAANQTVVSVKPETSLEEVVTLLLARDFSQMPVMAGERTVKGLISWKTIGSRLALGQKSGQAKDFMEDHHEVRSNQSIFEAIKFIKKYEYVIVRSTEDQKISGIITGSDLSVQFQLLSEPFLLLSEIENLIRNMIGPTFKKKDLKSARDPGDTREIDGVDDLTFGEYIRLLQQPEMWNKLNLAIDRNLFCADLDDVRVIRNEITHFDPDGITPRELEKLRDFKAFLQNIEDIAPKK